MEDLRGKKIEDVYAKWARKSKSSEPRSIGALSTQNGYSKPRGKSVTISAPRYSSATSARVNRQRQRILQGSTTGGRYATTTFLPSLGMPSTALHAASDFKYISESYCCPKCLPISRVKYRAHSGANIGLHNFLVVNKRKYGYFGCLFPHITYVTKIAADFNLRDLRTDVLQAKRVKDVVISCAAVAVSELDDQTESAYTAALEGQQKRAISIINSMSSAVPIPLLRAVSWVLLWVFGKLYNKVHVPKKHAAMLKKAQERGVPIVFLPSHKSHMDYIIMTFVLFNMGIHIPRIAAGDNLRIPFVSWLITHLGGFFIKRKFDTAAGKDVLYRKCLHEFMERSLCEGENLEFFIEGSRSRSGKPNSPKAGLLSILVDSVKEGAVEDILLVPVGISYDTIIEQNFVRHELMGGSKKVETFLKAVYGAWAMLTRNTGSVRIDFAQPFSLQEYLSTSTIASQSQLELTDVGQPRSILNMANLAYRKVVTALSQHIVYDLTHCASLMPTSIVSFLLLTKHRLGATEAELVVSYMWIEEMARTKKRSVGYTGVASEAVHYALVFLDSLLKVDELFRRNGQVSRALVIKPQLELPDVFELLYHANLVTPLLVLDAVIACSLHGLVGVKLRLKQEGRVEISKEELIEGAIQLCRILSREFIFAPPCLDLWNVLEGVVESLVNSDLLKNPPQVVNTVQPGKKLPRLQDVSDDEDEEVNRCHTVWLEVNTEEAALEHFSFLRTVLEPFLESYWSIALALLKMENNMEESAFLKEVQESLVHKAKKKMLRNVESCSMDMLRNAMKCLKDLGYISYKKGTQLQVTDADRLMEEVVERIATFRD